MSIRALSFVLVPWLIGCAPAGSVGSLDTGSAGSELAFGRLQGIYDVTSAGGISATDPVATRVALQAALDLARKNQLVAFFPRGTYTVDRGLTCREYPDVGSPGANGAVDPCVLLGSRAGEGEPGYQRPRLVLAPGAPPDILLHVFRMDTRDPTHPVESFNSHFYSKVINLDLVVSAGNPHVTALRMAGAQMTAVQDVGIRFLGPPSAGSNQVGFSGGLGGGGMVANLSVTGGDVGIDYTDAQAQPTLVGVTLSGQRRSALLYGSRGTLVAVGLQVVGFSGAGADAAAVVSTGEGAVDGRISVLDSTFDLGGHQVAIRTNRSVYLRDVYFRGGALALEVVDPSFRGPRMVPQPASWAHLSEYAQAVQPPVLRWHQTVGEDGERTDLDVTTQFESHVFGPGCGSASPCLATSGVLELVRGPVPIVSGANVAGAATSQHLWSSTASFETPGAVNVEWFRAAGETGTDATDMFEKALGSTAKVIVVPKGIYRVSRPLHLRAGQSLVGVSDLLSQIWADPTASQFKGQTAVLLDTPSNPSVAVQLSLLGLGVSAHGQVIPLDWRSGGPSAINRMVMPRFVPELTAADPYADRLAPLFRISGAGGGKIYGALALTGAGSSANKRYSGILVNKDATESPLNLYHVDAEGSLGLSEVRIIAGSHIKIFGLKCESALRSLWVSNAEDVNVYGYGGNANASPVLPPGSKLPAPVPELFKFEDSVKSFRLASAMDFGFYTTACSPSKCHPVLDEEVRKSDENGYGEDPHRWWMLTANDSGPNPLHPLERPILYRRALAK